MFDTPESARLEADSVRHGGCLHKNAFLNAPAEVVPLFAVM